MAYDFDIEDIEEFHKRYTWGEGLSNESIYNSKQTLPVICYDLIDLDKTKYHFLQDCFDNKDIKSYFKAIKYERNLTISYIRKSTILHYTLTKKHWPIENQL